jgi:hypothetical protein
MSDLIPFVMRPIPELSGPASPKPWLERSVLAWRPMIMGRFEWIIPNIFHHHRRHGLQLTWTKKALLLFSLSSLCHFSKHIAYNLLFPRHCSFFLFALFSFLQINCPPYQMKLENQTTSSIQTSLLSNSVLP